MSKTIETWMLTFAGSKADTSGMPEPYHHYMIFAGPAPYAGKSASVAMIVPMTMAPMPESSAIYVLAGSSTEAAQKAASELAQLQGNAGLERYLTMRE